VFWIWFKFRVLGHITRTLC